MFINLTNLLENYMVLVNISSLTTFVSSFQIPITWLKFLIHSADHCSVGPRNKRVPDRKTAPHPADHVHQTT